MAKEKEREYGIWEATPHPGDVVYYFPQGDRKHPQVALVQAHSASRPGELEMLVFPMGRAAGAYDSQYVRTGVRHADDPAHDGGEGFDLNSRRTNGTWDFRPCDKPRAHVWEFVKRLEEQRREAAERQAQLAREREAKRMEAATAS